MLFFKKGEFVMVNDGLIMELMKMLLEKPENFPRVLSAFVRRELLQQTKASDEQLELIRNEKPDVLRRRYYIREHLEDLAKSFDDLISFLEYFRDIPLGKNKEGIMTGEDVLMILEDIVDYAMTSVRELQISSESWLNLSEEEFNVLKDKAIEAAQDVSKMVHDLDYSLALAWTSSEESAQEEPERELKADFEFL